MGKIIIHELEVFYRVGVPDSERAQSQRLLVTIEMETDFTAAAASDDLARTIDYHAVTQRLLKFGEGRIPGEGRGRFLGPSPRRDDWVPVFAGHEARGSVLSPAR